MSDDVTIKRSYVKIVNVDLNNYMFKSKKHLRVLTLKIEKIDNDFFVSRIIVFEKNELNDTKKIIFWNRRLFC